MKLVSFRNLRVLILLLIAAWAAIYTKTQRVESMAWLDPLQLIILPINADGSAQTQTYIDNLQTATFEPIERFMSKQGKQHGVLAKPPIIVTIAPQVDRLPPPAPPPDAGVFSIGKWSLSLRYWAWINTPDGYDHSNSVHMFVLYQQAEPGQHLRHSLGLQKGLLGIVHAFATNDQNGQNNIVIAHELMHTVGATDKYDTNGLPVFPDGYARPNRSPRYPQRLCEIMAGKVSITAYEAEMPESLRSCMIGDMTAKEINWISGQD